MALKDFLDIHYNCNLSFEIKLKMSNTKAHRAGTKYILCIPQGLYTIIHNVAVEESVAVNTLTIKVGYCLIVKFLSEILKRILNDKL